VFFYLLCSQSLAGTDFTIVTALLILLISGHFGARTCDFIGVFGHFESSPFRASVLMFSCHGDHTADQVTALTRSRSIEDQLLMMVGRWSMLDDRGPG
jgi:hypothetical protein